MDTENDFENFMEFVERNEENISVPKRYIRDMENPLEMYSELEFKKRYRFQINSKSLPSKETLRGHSDSSFRGEGYIQCCVGVRLYDMYSNQELAEIHFMYGKADGNAALARRLYQERYPQRQCPDRKTFVRLHYRLCEYGKFKSPGLGRGRPRSTTPEVQEEILEAVNMTPSISTRMVYRTIAAIYRSDGESRKRKDYAISEEVFGDINWLRVFENKVLRKIFGAKRDEATGEWRKLHNRELYALYSSPDVIRNIKSRRLRWTGHVARMGESRNAYRVLVGRPEGKRPLGKPRRRWEDNIKMDLRGGKYLGATITNINDTLEEIKRRINMGNACYYSVEKLLSFSLLSKSLKVRIYKTVILPVVLYGCETWILTLREEQRLREYENKVLRKIFGAKRDEVTEEWRKFYNAELHALYSSPDIIRNIKSRRLRWTGHVARSHKCI
ncbi:hypothetical protein ANN_20395 [Periplaneta americana]|uniref:DUF4817 domain-containing protein n=1 Tax=Periplaneta americana TaxID=6978 RepID=A0ABQ8SDM1_PERAM|nr:hypothetical protein ANN_20395 [Periplaneta americana]